METASTDAPTVPATHSKDEIVKSAVFRYINRQIDEKAARVKAVLEDLPNRLKECEFRFGYDALRVRTHEEIIRGAQEYAPLVYDLQSLERIATAITECRALEKQIRELQRSKCELLNDYDFTHGDPEWQLAVFGPAA